MNEVGMFLLGAWFGITAGVGLMAVAIRYGLAKHPPSQLWPDGQEERTDEGERRRLAGLMEISKASNPYRTH